jgi:hypothetical protein
MTDLEKLIKTFDEIGVEYDNTIHVDEVILVLRDNGYRQDFIFIDGKFIRVEIY